MSDLRILGQSVAPDAFADTMPMWVYCDDYISVCVYADGDWRVSFCDAEYGSGTDPERAPTTPEEAAKRAEDVVVGHLRAVLESLPEAVRERVVAR